MKYIMNIKMFEYLCGKYKIMKVKKFQLGFLLKYKTWVIQQHYSMSLPL